YNTCSDENVNHLPGSLTGGGSWCLDAKLLASKEEDSNHKNIEGVCAQVLCEGGTVKVKYLGSNDFHPCPEGTEIPVASNEFKEGGKIKCPKYGEACTIAANGSSLVIPSILSDEKRDEQGGRPMVAPAVSTGEEGRTKASSADLPAADYSSVAAVGTDGDSHAGRRGEPEVQAGGEEITQLRGRRAGSGSEGCNRTSDPNVDAPSPGEGVAPAEGDPAVTPTASASATPVPSVNSSDVQATPDVLAQQVGNDGGVAAAAAGFSPLVLLAVVAAAVAMVP
ncbi:surface protease GP63, putative, partial [Trypanosoma cruzi marinkellei]